MHTDTEQVSPQAASPPVLQKDWRFYAGVAALVLSCVMPLFALFVPLLGLSGGWTTTIIGALVAGGPEVLILAAAALLGKETLHYFLHTAKSGLRKALLAQPVPKGRYYVGVAISVASLVPLYLYGYLPAYMPEGNARIYILAAADLSFVLSVFIMGGEFWDKFRRLFIWEGKS